MGAGEGGPAKDSSRPAPPPENSLPGQSKEIGCPASRDPSRQPGQLQSPWNWSRQEGIRRFLALQKNKIYSWPRYGCLSTHESWGFTRPSSGSTHLLLLVDPSSRLPWCNRLRVLLRTRNQERSTASVSQRSIDSDDITTRIIDSQSVDNPRGLSPLTPIRGDHILIPNPPPVAFQTQNTFRF